MKKIKENSNIINHLQNKKITVLMSVYNGEKYLNQAIDSILNQTFRDFEFLIINDGSNDRTSKILKSYNDIRIKIINNEKNIGLTKSLNKGLKIAKGEYIARMDADDISYTSRLEIQYNYLEGNQEVGIVGSWNDVINSNGETIEVSRRPYSPEYIYFILHFRNCLTHCSVMFRKDLLSDIGYYDEKINNAQDYELWNRVSKKVKVHQIPMLLVKWRKTNNSISSKQRNSQMKTVNNVVKSNLESLINEKINEKTIHFIHKNYENPNYHCLITLTRDELLYSIDVVDRISRRIIDEAPHSLNKENIRKIVKNKLINYIYVLSLKISMLDSTKCVNKYISENVWMKIKIIIWIIYKKLRFFIWNTLRNQSIYSILRERRNDE